MTSPAAFAPGAGAGKTDSTYLRGEEGNDTITGSLGFDDINGNQGDDVLHGDAGDDWVVGGKDNDQQFGDAGGDIVWGNLGNDTLDGGDGADQVRGGQGDDVVNGGAGNDYVSGDRGNDTITGGAGADNFHGSQDAGIDKVMDFHLSEGDRVELDPGTTFTVSQVGADTVIDMGSGNQMILVGVQMSTLPAGTIFPARGCRAALSSRPWPPDWRGGRGVAAQLGRRQRLGVDPLPARTEGGAMQDAGGGGEGGAGGGVGQMGHAARTAQAHRTVEHAHRHLAHAGQLTGAAGQHQARAGLDGRAGILQSVTEQFAWSLPRAGR